VSDVRFFTQADSRFFVAAVAMLESLERSGNRGRAYVLDVGLSIGERERLAALADILTLPTEADGLHPMQMKATADLFWSSGIVVLLDSDMIVTAPLDDMVEQARAGRIAVHPDHDITKGRQFPEWQTTFELAAPLRPQAYVNCVPMAISLDRWSSFFRRWRDACLRVPADWPTQGFNGPFGLPAQDAMNAVLMSEIPEEAIWVGAAERTVHADGLPHVEIVDPSTLDCRYRGARPVVLHYGLNPKAWERSGWRRIRAADSYVRLLRHLLFERDAPIAIRSSEVPVWLRPRVGPAAAHVIGLVNLVRVDLRNRARLRSRVRVLRKAALRHA
jgi:hypothetical protein